MNNTVAAKLNADKQEAVIATKDGIKVLGYGDIKLSELVAMRQDDSAPSSYEAFCDFHNSNPWVLEKLTSMAKDLKAVGVNKYSLRGFFHIVRHKYILKTKDASRFMLNNNYSPYYARLIMRLNPELEGFFEIRTQKTKEVTQ